MVSQIDKLPWQHMAIVPSEGHFAVKIPLVGIRLAHWDKGVLCELYGRGRPLPVCHGWMTLAKLAQHLDS